MDRILTRICSINDHPISYLDIKHKETYIRGLGAGLCQLSNNSSIVRLFFDVWAKCIWGTTLNIDSIWVKDIKSIKSAISIQRTGVKFFSMKYSFFFDIFYLIQSAQRNGYNPTISDEIMTYFKKKICGFFTKDSLMKTYEMFQSNMLCKETPASLIHHKESNERYLAQKDKKVLVIANISAGKSTLINSLSGFSVSRTKNTACTDKLVYFENKMSADGMMIQNGTEYVYYENVNDVTSDSFTRAAFHFNSTLSRHRICLIDTPGINNAENSIHRKITENAIRNEVYDAIIYVSNCQYLGTNDERSILEFLKRNSHKPIIFVLNQLDRFKQREDSVEKMLQDYSLFLKSIGFRSPNILPISADAGLLLKQDTSSLDEDDAYEQEEYKRKFSKEFYSLPQYIDKRFLSKNILENTGIPMLEQTIIQILKY